MPNKKINQLDLKTAVGTDLMLVGDPVNGTAFKSTLDNLPLVPTSRVLTINGVPFDLSQNRAWTIDALPPQAGNTGKYLTTDGSVASWGTIDLSGYVPYTGASTNVNLGEYQLLAGQVTFDQSPTGAAGVGVMRWNNTDGTLDLGLKGGNVSLQVGQEQVVRVVNKSGSALNEAAYQVVKITDAQGQRLAVDLAQGNNDANSTDTIGIVTETIAINQEGFITTSGLVNEINTTGSLQGETWIDGDVIYLSPFTAGAITNIKPTAPNHTVILGYVVYAHAIHGKIFVKCDNGFEIGELHNCYLPTPANNDGIFWNTANSRYQNNSIAGVLGFTPVSGTGTNNYIPKFASSGSVLENSNIFLSSGADFKETTIGSTIGTANTYNKLNILAKTEAILNLIVSDGFNSAFFNSYGNIGLSAIFSSPSVNNNIFYYEGSSSTNRRLIFQTEGNNRLVINQSGNIGINTTTETPSAQLEVLSTTKGFLPPRMTTTQKLAIASPATGLVVFDTTLTTLNVFNGTTWGTLINGVDELQVALLSQVYG